MLNKLPAGCSQSGLKPRGTTLSAVEIIALYTADDMISAECAPNRCNYVTTEQFCDITQMVLA